MDIEEVAVVGAGTMGAGIAQLAATAGCNVRLIEINREVLDVAITQIAARLDRSVERERITDDQRSAISKRIVPQEAIDDLSNVQLVIEAVVEDFEVKRSVFRALEKTTSPDAVLATNTSSLRVSKIASCIKQSQRVVGMHFFNPAVVMPLVEVVAADKSDERSLETVTNAARGWGKTPVRAKDTPGFIVNRVARGFYLEALRLLGEGLADVATVDSAMCTLGNFRMGPFQLMDLVGLDVNYAVSCSVWEQSGKPVRLKPHDIQRDLVAEERLGRKSKRGFYRYESNPPVVNVECHTMTLSIPEKVSRCVTEFSSAAALCDRETLDASSTLDRYIFSRILATIMNEASLALDEHVAMREDIDIAMQKGTNYPKGPLAWIEHTGRVRVEQMLSSLNELSGDGRFEPAGSLKT